MPESEEGENSQKVLTDSLITEEKNVPFLQKLEKAATKEEKIALLIEEMREAISQHGRPNFKMFWKAKQMALALFKENLHPLLRSQYWNQFVELSQAARQLKSHLEEETNFALEQIALAIAAIHEDRTKIDVVMEQLPQEDFLEALQSASFKKEDYQIFQKELHVLNTLAFRTNALRREVVEMNMRSRDKNRFFKELSLAADAIFPRRRELIQKVSEKFSCDVDAFIAAHFRNASVQKPYFLLREKIKAIQNLSKILTLNTETFTSTRHRLSECWNQVRAWEKERKKEMAKIRQENQATMTEAQVKIQEFEKLCLAASSLKDVESAYQKIDGWMQKLSLQKRNKHILLQALDVARAPLVERQRMGKEQGERKKKEDGQKKKETLLKLKEEIKSLVHEASIYDYRLEDLIEKNKEIRNQLQGISLTSQEKQFFERLFFPLDGMIEDRKIASSPHAESVQEYRNLLEQKKRRHGEIKKQIENYRKAMNSSGMDFEKAMSYQELMEMEKERLEKVEEEMQRIEEKIENLLP